MVIALTGLGRAVRYRFSALGVILVGLFGSDLHATAAAAPQCPFVAFDTVLYDAAGVTRLRVQAGPGVVRIEGRAATDQVRVYARRCASTLEVLEHLWFDVQREGSEMRVGVRIPTELFRPDTGTVAIVDLVVQVPPRLTVDIRDGQGTLQVSGVHALDAQLALGDVHIADIVGDVSVKAGPGDVDVQHVDGNVEISLTVGHLSVRRVRGGATVAAGHVGRSILLDIRGTVTVGDGHTGDLSVDGVGGDLVIGTIRRGTVQYTNVNGRVTRKDGSSLSQ